MINVIRLSKHLHLIDLTTREKERKGKSRTPHVGCTPGAIELRRAPESTRACVDEGKEDRFSK